jgi:dihydroxyacetone kinase
VRALLATGGDGGGRLTAATAGAAGYGLLADAISGSMGGTSGALVEVALRAGRVALLAQANKAGGVVEGQDRQARPCDHAGAFRAGVEAVAEVGGASAGMRTMLDALLPAAAALEATAAATEEAEGRGGAASWAAAASAAEAGAEATRAMGALAGRSNYVNAELLATVPDPGAKAVAIAMRAAVDSSA